MAESTPVVPQSRIPRDLQHEGPLVGAARTIEETARQVKEKVVHAKDEVAQKTLGELVNDGTEFVRKNPGATILVSVGVGALVGYMLGRRRS